MANIEMRSMLECRLPIGVQLPLGPAELRLCTLDSFNVMEPLASL
jgi:hypothetical protein